MNAMRSRWGLVCVMLALIAPAAVGQEVHDVTLPPPRMEGGKPLMQALKERMSSRVFSAEKLSPQIMSDLLWAAAGINRPDSGKRTAPSAMNWQEVEVYVVVEEGSYVYDAKANSLRGVAGGDLRKLAGIQEYVATAPLNLVYVADTTKVTRASPEDLPIYLGADTAFISENVYLYCASAGLATVVRAYVDRPALAAALKLPPHKRIILAQTVGYPAGGKVE
jgi:nitroreductase